MHNDIDTWVDGFHIQLLDISECQIEYNSFYPNWYVLENGKCERTRVRHFVVG